MEVDIKSKEVVNGALDAMVEDGGLGLGVQETRIELVSEGNKVAKVVVKEGKGEGAAADWVAEDVKARGAFSRGREERKCMSERGSIGGREGGEEGGAIGGDEEFCFEEVEADAMGLAKFLEALKEEGDVTEGKVGGDIIKKGHGGSKRAKTVITRSME